MSENWSTVDEYICDTLLERDEVLEEVLRLSEAEGLPRINVAPNQGKFLHLLARMRGAKNILEIGTLAGYSTIWLARALPVEGRVVTIEFENHHADVAERNIAAAGLASCVDVRRGTGTEVLSAMIEQAEGPFDFIFIDADKSSYPRYLELALQLSQPGTVIVGDNVVRRGELPNVENGDSVVLGVRTFIQMLGAHEKIDATAVQTVGSKGHDGFALGIVTE